MRPGSESDFALQRLKNQTGTAEGSNLLPLQNGQFRVPFVSNLRLIRTVNFPSSTQFTIAWDEPALSNVSHYAVYIKNSSNKSQPPLGPYISQASPAQISIPAQTAATITFLVQTVLKNGFVSDFDSSPTCTSVTTDNIIHSNVVIENTISTTDATVTTISTITIPATTTLAIDSIVVARRVSGSSGTAEDGARYSLRAVYKNVAGAATIIGAITKIADEDQAGWNATITTSGGTILVQVQGAANNLVDWVAVSSTYQVS